MIIVRQIIRLKIEPFLFFPMYSVKFHYLRHRIVNTGDFFVERSSGEFRDATWYEQLRWPDIIGIRSDKRNLRIIIVRNFAPRCGATCCAVNFISFATRPATRKRENNFIRVSCKIICPRTRGCFRMEYRSVWSRFFLH